MYLIKLSFTKFLLRIRRPWLRGNEVLTLVDSQASFFCTFCTHVFIRQRDSYDSQVGQSPLGWTHSGCCSRKASWISCRRRV